MVLIRWIEKVGRGREAVGKRKELAGLILKGKIIYSHPPEH
jgi:hypothetical protein